MKFLLLLFAGITAVGLFLLLIGFVGSHGHLQFRPHMTEDWVIFGTPQVGILGFILVTINLVKNRNK